MWHRDTVQDDVLRTPPTTAVPTVPAVSLAADERRVIAWVGKSILFRGDLIGLEDMTIDGRVEGTIELSNHALTVGPDAHIQADITAKVVNVLGQVVGTIKASDRVEIGATGSVDGDIVAERLAIADGAVVRGRIETGRPRPRDTEEPHASAVSAPRG